MSEAESIEALDRTVTATWEQERSTPVLRSYLGILATKAGLSEHDPEIDELLAA